MRRLVWTFVAPTVICTLFLRCVSYGLRVMRKTRLRAYADSEGPDQPAHSRSLIRAFTVRCQSNWILHRMYEWRANAWMMVCACAGWSESAHFAHVRRHVLAWWHIMVIYNFKYNANSCFFLAGIHRHMIKIIFTRTSWFKSFSSKSHAVSGLHKGSVASEEFIF